METLDEYSIREGTPEDKIAVLSIRENVYDGRDYLPEYYDDFMTSQNVTPFVLCHQERIVGFIAANIVDGGETLVSRAGRIRPDYEGKELYGYLDNYVNQWAKGRGARLKAFTASAKNKNVHKASFRAQNRMILSKSHLIYILQEENLDFSQSDNQPEKEIWSFSSSDLKICLQSEDTKSNLFPGGRISINSVPYKLMESNIPLIMNDKHTIAFSNLELNSSPCKGLLSFGTLYKVQRFSYQYTIDIYGSDQESVRLHVLRHLMELKHKATGSVCVLLPFQKELSPDHVDKICLKFRAKRENTPTSDDSGTWITCDFLFEKTL